MKLSIIPVVLLAFLATSLADELEVAAAAKAEKQPRTELEQLRQDFERRRAEALRPVSGWYREQLEVLRKRLAAEAPDSEAEVAEVLKAARETFWQEDQPELAQALVRSTWSWRSHDDPQGVPVTFRSDATVEHIGLRGTWRINGPSQVTITTEDQGCYILHFNTSLSAYATDRDDVSGVRLPALR